MSDELSRGPVERIVRPVAETDEWKLQCFLDWRPKYKDAPCPVCRGRGTVGGGFKDIDGPMDCPKCLGRGVTTVAPTSRPPAVPPELSEHMRRAWWDFFNGPNAGAKAPPAETPD